MAGFDLGRIGAWAHLDTLSAADARAWARRVDELGFGTLWVPETVGREPVTLLGTDALRMIAPVPGGSPFEDEPRRGRLTSVLRHGDELFVRYRFDAAR
ncbi:MAG TPA: hypothetical protein VJ975_08485 [Candidatus Limnocylindria bacterium]|nr:hypothetical protein [Candidatus Limnocylindria bacterium]